MPMAALLIFDTIRSFEPSEVFKLAEILKPPTMSAGMSPKRKSSDAAPAAAVLTK